MNTRETFYVHVHGEQLGPYTIRHIDHLLQSGLIPAETLYWTEGLDQWLPVTELIPLRKAPRRLRQMVIALVFLLPILGLAWFFGPTVIDGWREQTQREYTSHAAYWAARGIVRSFVDEKQASPAFEPEAGAVIQLEKDFGATVKLDGVFLSGTRSGEHVSWTVRLRFDPEGRQWSAAPAAPDSPASSAP